MFKSKFSQKSSPKPCTPPGPSSTAAGVSMASSCGGAAAMVAASSAPQPLLLDTPSSCPTSRRRSVHFDSLVPSTVFVPGCEDEGSIRGSGTKFASHKKIPSDIFDSDEMANSKLPAKIIEDEGIDEDEETEMQRYQMAQARRRQSAPAAHFYNIPEDIDKRPHRKLRSPPPPVIADEEEEEEGEEERGEGEDHQARQGDQKSNASEESGIDGVAEADEVANADKDDEETAEFAGTGKSDIGTTDSVPEDKQSCHKSNILKVTHL